LSYKRQRIQELLVSISLLFDFLVKGLHKGICCSRGFSNQGWFCNKESKTPPDRDS